MAPSADDPMAARERRWKRGTDPAVLWPGVHVPDIQRAADDIGRATVAVMRGQPATLHTAVDARTLGIAALVTGVGPLLGYWIERGELTAPPDAAAILGQHLAHGRARSARVEAGVAPVLGALARAGTGPLLMKGFHTARFAFPDPGTRPFADVDVIVRPEHVARAEGVLAEAGFSAPPAKAGPYKRDWRLAGAGHTASFELWHEDSAWSLELHDGVNFEMLHHFGARLDLHDAAEPAVAPLPPGVLVPRPAALLAILATHGSLERYSARLLRGVELVLVVRRLRDAGRLDWAGFEALLQRSRAARFVYPALSLAERLAPGTIDAGVLARARRATTARARALDATLTLTAPILRDDLRVSDRLLWADTTGEVLRELVAIARPPAGASPLEALRDYHARALRLVSKLASRHGAQASPADREP